MEGKRENNKNIIANYTMLITILNVIALKFPIKNRDHQNG